MFRAVFLALAVFVAGIAPVHASTAPTAQGFLEGTGSACLTGGAVFGLTAFFVGPAALTMAGTQILPATAMTTSGISAMLGCGASAVVAMAYYGIQWTYDLLYSGWEYPLLYPLRDDFAEAAPAK